jgi:hypothetical protein
MTDRHSDLGAEYLASVSKDLRRLKELAEKAIAQLSDEAHFHVLLDKESNSIAVLIRHLRGNMLSRWTDFLTTDGEKESRQRDTEFEQEVRMTPDELLEAWNQGWDRLFQTLSSLTPADLQRKVSVRGAESSVLEAIQRELTHYASHVGQIVFLAKHLEAEKWESLSIPRGQSSKYFRT